MLRHLRVVMLVAVCAVIASSGSRIFGQAAPPVADEFAGLHFRSIGPASMSGRVSDLAVYEANPAVWYVGTAHGGVWKTTSNGNLFEAQFQNESLMSIGAVAMSQKDPNLVWAGTGESNNRQSTSWGDGVYKSTDGGRTWKNMGLKESRHINRIVVDKDDANIVFVAATGPLFGPGGDRGVYKTTDGGTTWKMVLKGDADTGANDLVVATTDKRIMYASMYQRRRVQCCMNGGGPGSGIFKSTDAGETWTRLSTGLPAGSLGRIGLDVFRRSANILYALVEAEGPAGGGGRGGAGGGGGAAGAAAGGGRGAGGAGAAGGRGGAAGAAAPAPAPQAPAAAQAGTGLYRSDDGGANWRRVNAANPRPMYFSQVRIDPNNPDVVYLGGVGVHLTTDGGVTMGTDVAQVIHDDIHAIWINPANSEHVLIGGDGGVAVSWDRARTWMQYPNLPLALYYHVGYDFETPYNVCGGLQDNYNWCGPSATRSSRGIVNSNWFQVQGGDGFVAIVDPRDSRIVYSESQDGNIQRKNKITGESRNIRPNFQNTSPAPADGALPFRWNWDTPIVFSPHESGALWVAANKVFKSNDKGDSWTVMSPDLTTNADRNEIEVMGLRGTDIRIARNDGISSWPTIVSLAESPKQPGMIFTGSDDGLVAMSKDGGKTWDRDLANRMPGFPKGTWISEVVPSKFDANTVYVTVDGHRLNDYNTYVYASTDAGATFRSTNANLKGEVVRTMTEDPRNADVLYLGTESGIFVTIDRGKSWKRLRGRNFPNVRVDEITIHPRDNAMIVGTHGRAVWILDHLEPIQEYAAAQAATADAKLFAIPNAMQWRSKDDQNDEFWGHQTFVGENPPTDAVIQFFIKKPVNDLRFKITDVTGREVRELILPAGRNVAGIGTICWDMRVQPLPAIAPAGGGGGAPGGAAGAPGGGAAAPGRAGGGGGGGGQAGAPGGGRGGGAGGGIGFTPLPVAGVMPFNPCGGGGGFGGGASPLVLPGTYTVAMTIGGKVVESKTMKVTADSGFQMNDVSLKRYNDVVMDLHDLQRRGIEMANALNSVHAQMTELAAKVPADAKAQFDAAQKELDAIRPKFGAAAPGAGGAGGAAGGAGGGGGRGGGGAPVNTADLVGRTGAIKTQMLAFVELPSDSLMKGYQDVKLALPKAIADGNAFLVKAMTLSAALKKHNQTLTVPAPVK